MAKKTKRIFLSLLLTLATVFLAFGFASCDQEETPTTYTVTFISEFGVAPPAQTVEAGQTATQPEAPTHDVHEFQKWIREGVNDGTSYDFSTPITQDITLYAQWTFNYLVTFDSNGGSNVPDFKSESPSDLQEPETPVKAQQYFLGWYLPDGTKFTFDNEGQNLLNTQEQLHLTAKWTDALTTNALVGTWTFWYYNEQNLSGQPTFEDFSYSVTFTESTYVCTYYSLSIPTTTGEYGTVEGTIAVVNNEYVLTNAANATAKLIYNKTTDTWKVIDITPSKWGADDYDEWWYSTNEETVERSNSNGVFDFQAGTYTATVLDKQDKEYLCTITMTEDGVSTVTLQASNEETSLTLQKVWNYADRLFVNYNFGYDNEYFVLQWKAGTLQAFNLWHYADTPPNCPLDFDVTFTKQA